MSASIPIMNASIQEQPADERAGGHRGEARVRDRQASASRYDVAVLRQRLLARTVEDEIVPRLVLSRRGLADAAPITPTHGWIAAERDVAEFSRAVLAREPGVARTFIADLRAHGASLEQIYLDLFTPTARRLGQLWEDDELDFMQVTEGLGRMQHALHEFSPAFADEIAFHGHGRRALLAPAPGEQHTFGLGMVAEFFRRAGWNVWMDPAADAGLVDLVRGEWFAVIGFSCLNDASMDAVAAMIRRVRRASRNRSIGVMVGGPAFIAHPEMAALVGADATASDGRQAVLQAQNLLAMLPGRD